mgnify:CR=1 FL=1
MVKNRFGRVVELKTATIEELTSNYLLKWSIFMKTVRLILLLVHVFDLELRFPRDPRNSFVVVVVIIRATVRLLVIAWSNVHAASVPVSASGEPSGSSEMNL